jgi:hypothetical protein
VSNLYPEQKPNEWIQPVRSGYRMACCDCGLVHEIDFRIVKGRVQFRVRRNDRSTGQMRRHLFKKFVKNENMST